MKRPLISMLSMLLVCLTALGAGPSGTLPILHIDTDNGQSIVSKEDYVDATYWLETKGVADMGENIGTQQEPLAMQIRGRGNYTWVGFDKKPYRLKLGKKAELLGMNSSKHWALLAHADDSQGFLRNHVGFQISRLLGMEWTPGDKPCEVMLNGEYIGLYFLTETVRVDKKRVNVTNGDDEVEDWLEANPGMTAADYPYTDLDKTGGWLVEIDNYDDPDQVSVESRNPRSSKLRVTYDTPSDYITDAHKEWLSSAFREMDNLIYDNADWSTKIDIESAAQFFIVNQLMGNYESYSGSFKLHRDRGLDTKWIFGPVWDFGSGLQNPGAMQRWIWNGVYSQFWVDALWQSETYKAKVKELYAQFMDNGNMLAIGEYIDDFAERIQAAALCDYQRWNACGYGNEDVRVKAQRVKFLLNQSVKFMNDNLDYDGNDDPFGPIDYYDYPSLQLYLRGTVSGWDCKDEYLFKYTGADGIFTLDIPELSGEFKIADKEWFLDYGYDDMTAPFPLDRTVELNQAGANIKIDGNLSNVHLVFDCANATLRVVANYTPDVPDEYEDMTIYLRGEINTWNADPKYQFTYTGADGVFTLNVSSLSGSFKLADSDWTYDKGYGTSGDEEKLFPMDKSMPITDKGANIKLEKEGGDVTLILDEKNQTLRVATGSGIDNIADDNAPAIYFNMQGIRVNRPSRGIYIVKRGNKITKESL